MKKCDNITLLSVTKSVPIYRHNDAHFYFIHEPIEISGWLFGWRWLVGSVNLFKSQPLKLPSFRAFDRLAVFLYMYMYVNIY